MAEKLIGF